MIEIHSPHITSRVNLPLPRNTGVLEKVKFTLGVTVVGQNNVRTVEDIGWYIMERGVSSVTVLEEQRWLSESQIKKLIMEYHKEKKLPDDLAEAVEASILLAKKIKTREDKKRILNIANEWAKIVSQRAGKQIFNQII